MKKSSRKLIKKAFALMLAVVMAVPAADYGTLLTVQAEETGNAGITLRARNDGKAASAGYEEGAYVEWLPVTGADGYVVSVSQDQSTWMPIDDELIRSYGTYFRADALGLKPGTWNVKIEAVTVDGNNQVNGKIATKIEEVAVTSQDRSGYAWEGYADAQKADDNLNTPGAYKKDGTLKDGAQVIYVTNVTKNTVSLEVGGETHTGIQNILYAYKDGKGTNPLAVRIIGNVDDFAVMDAGDMAIENAKKMEAGITIEGIGEDAVANGWGIRVDKAYNIEIRNLAFMNCDSTQLDNVGLWQENEHIWVHNCDFFYGEQGSDSDQKKGDGMLDCKKSNWVTFSYNHFWDSGKSSLLGLEENSNEYYATYHHNWFDHSDSRHPRVRFYTVHIYNNYYDGVAKYGIGGAAGGASIFSENNYFKNTKHPMLISMQGNDTGTLSNEDGSIIKSYGDYMDDTSKSKFIPYPIADAASALLETLSDFVKYVALDDETGVADVNDIIPGDDGIVNKNDVEDFDTDITLNEEEITYTDVNESEDEENISDIDAGQSENEEDISEADADKPKSEEDTLDTDAGQSTVEENLSDTGESVVNEEAEVSEDVSGDAAVDFDAYVAKTRDEKVPSSVRSKQGGKTYNNFDTASDFYSYKLDAAADVPAVVMSKAGRLNGGDFKYTFTDADNDSSEVISALKEQCENYSTKLKAVGGLANTDAKIYYTITFDPDNGEDTYTIRVEEKTLIEEPVTPTIIPDGKEKFGGWYKGARRWNFATDKPVKDMTLKVKWLKTGEEEGPYGRSPIDGKETIIYDITTEVDDNDYFDATGTFDSQGGDSGVYFSADGTELSYSSRNGKSRLDMRNSATITFDTTKAVRLILFLDKSRSGSNTNIDGKAYAQTNGIINAIIMPGEHTITKKDGDLLYAIMAEPIDSSETYKVTIDLNDGSAKDIRNVSVGDQIPASDMPEANRPGYKLKGWKDDNNIFIELPYTPTGDVTLTAVWVNSNDMELTASEIDAGDYTSSFDKNGFIITAGSNNKVSVDNGSKTIDGKSYTARLKTGGKGTADYRSIKFTTQGAATLYIACMAASGDKNKLPKMAVATVNGSTLTDYTNYYYLIDGRDKENEDMYKKCSDGSISVDGNSGHFIIIELPDNAEYCIYSKENGINFYYISVTHTAYTVTFDTNGGSPVGTQTVNSGDTCNEPVDDPAREGYTFGGWYKDEDLTQEYDFATPVTGDITLYAKWTDNSGNPNPPADIFTVAFNTNGGSEVALQTINSGETCTKPADPTKAGHTFAGWYTDSACTAGNEYVFTTPVTEDITLYAKWTPNTNQPKGFNIEFKDNEPQYYTGSAIKPEITVTYNNGTGEKPLTLVENTDYTVKYSNNTKAASKALNTAKNKLPKITVTGKGRFSGSAYVNFEILQKNLADDDITVSGAAKTDDAAEAKLTVIKGAKVAPVIYYNSIKLAINKDYTVTGASGKYTEGNDGGTLTIKAKENSNYTGTIDIKMSVLNQGEKFKASFDTNDVKNLVYNGQEQKKVPKLNPSSMSKGTDYELVYSADVINAGTVKCTVVGMGKYTGCSITKTYKIKPAKKEDKDFTVVLPKGESYSFESAGVTPEVEVYIGEVKPDNKPLELGKDYKVTYSNNKKVSTTSKKAACKITFLGNYKGSKLDSKPFTIVPTPLCNNSEDTTMNTGGLEVVIPNKVSNNGKPGVYKSVPYVSINNVALKKSDYTVEYYTDAELKTPMDSQHKVSPGETGIVYVKIKGKGNYKSTDASQYIKAKYTVQNKATDTIGDLSKATVTLNDKKPEYTGEAQADNVKEIKIKGTNQTIAYKDFKDNGISVYYVNNKAKGKATIVIVGDGTKFVGSKTATFNITARKVKLEAAN